MTRALKDFLFVVRPSYLLHSSFPPPMRKPTKALPAFMNSPPTPPPSSLQPTRLQLSPTPSPKQNMSQQSNLFEFLAPVSDLLDLHLHAVHRTSDPPSSSLTVSPTSPHSPLPYETAMQLTSAINKYTTRAEPAATTDSPCARASQASRQADWKTMCDMHARAMGDAQKLSKDLCETRRRLHAETLHVRQLEHELSELRATHELEALTGVLREVARLRDVECMLREMLPACRAARKTDVERGEGGAMGAGNERAGTGKGVRQRAGFERGLIVERTYSKRRIRTAARCLVERSAVGVTSPSLMCLQRLSKRLQIGVPVGDGVHASDACVSEASCSSPASSSELLQIRYRSNPV